MSTPIMMCRAWKIAKGDDSGLEQLLQDMEYNLSLGHWSEFGCSHSPPCTPPTEDQLKAFNERFNRLLRERREARARSRPPTKEGDPDAFKHFVAPVIASAFKDAPVLDELLRVQPMLDPGDKK